MKLTGFVLLALLPLSALAKTDYKGPLNSVGGTMTSKEYIESCVSSRSAQLDGVTYSVARDSQQKQSMYTYNFSEHKALNYRVTVTDTGINRVLYISHEYTEDPVIKKIDETLSFCAGNS